MRYALSIGVLLLPGCSVTNTMNPPHVRCASGIDEIASDDASWTGFSAEDVWNYLEEGPFGMDLVAQNATQFSSDGDVTITRADGPVYWVEDWGVEFEGNCRDAPMVRVPAGFEMRTNDGLIHAQGTVFLDAMALELGSIWFEEGHSGYIPVDDVPALDDELATHDDPPPSEGYQMAMWSGLGSDQGGSLSSKWTDGGETRGEMLFHFTWTIERP